MDIVHGEWYCCEQCSTFFPSETVLKLHEKQVPVWINQTPESKPLKYLFYQMSNPTDAD